MGISSLPLTLLLAAAPLPVQPAVKPAPQPPAEPMSELAYQRALLQGGLPELTIACVDAARFGLDGRLQQLRDRLMLVRPAPQPFPVVMANAQALIFCKAPDSAQTVLNRFGPGPGQQRREWLLLSWRAASSALDHERAALALRRLAAGNLAALDAEQLVVAQPEGGEPLTRSALDLLAEYEASTGHLDRAAEVLLAGRTPGVVAAQRYGQVAVWVQRLGQERTDSLLEAALDQAAAEQAWSLAEDLLRLQLRLNLEAGGDGQRARQRLERLATRVDDRFTLWELLQDDPDLARQLRSPRAPGGHAALGESGPVSPSASPIRP